jgi:aspartate-semialdehyde dehydrogenase
LFRGEKLIEVNKIVNDIDEDMVVVDCDRIPAFLAKSKLSMIEYQVTAAYDEIDDGVWQAAEELYGLSGIEGRIKDLNVQRMINKIRQQSNDI